MDVRTMFGVGERLQDGNIRRYGDACDSLDLWDEKLVGEAHAHRRPDPDRDLLAKTLRNRVEAVVGNWDPAPGASGPEVAHAPRRLLPVGLAGYKLVYCRAEVASEHYCGGVGTRYALERTLAPGKIRG